MTPTYVCHTCLFSHKSPTKGSNPIFGPLIPNRLHLMSLFPLDHNTRLISIEVAVPKVREGWLPFKAWPVLSPVLHNSMWSLSAGNGRSVSGSSTKLILSTVLTFCCFCIEYGTVVFRFFLFFFSSVFTKVWLPGQQLLHEIHYNFFYQMKVRYVNIHSLKFHANIPRNKRAVEDFVAVGATANLFPGTQKWRKHKRLRQPS